MRAPNHFFKKFLIFVATVLVFTLSSAAQKLNIYCEDAAQYQNTDGKMTGLDIDIVSELQKRVGNTDMIQFVPWTRAISYLDSQPDTILFSLARTKERNDLYQWIGPISETEYGFYARADSTIVINSIDDAKKLPSIGVYRNDIRDQFLTKEGFTNLDRTANNLSNFKKLMAGHVVVIASTSLAIRSESRRAGFNEKDAKFLYSFLKLPIYIAASKTTDPKVVELWNTALDSMKRDGTLKAIFKKYLPDQDLPGPKITVF